jgi:Ca2+-binding EF-hand superfamily protein
MQFRSADTDGDGYLSRREVRARFPYMARVFERVDTDGDGRISFDEFLKFRAEQLERKAER